MPEFLIININTICFKHLDLDQIDESDERQYPDKEGMYYEYQWGTAGVCSVLGVQ
jgi:hypothetical protein